MSTKEKITKVLDSLIEYVEALPLSKKVKGGISFNILMDFIDSWQVNDETKESYLEIVQDKNGEPKLVPTNMTYGITNIRQLRRYIKDFQYFIKVINTQRFKNLSNKLRSESPTKSIDFVLKKLDEINKSKIEDEIFGKSSINKEQTLFEFFLRNEKDYLFNIANIDDKNRLINYIIESCSQLQGLFKILKDDENSRNTFIANTLNNRFNSWKAKDQSLWGSSEKGKKSGEVDIIVENDRNEKIAILEFLNLQSISSREITLHVNKVFKYDPNGLNTKIIGVYYRGVKSTFGNFWNRYIKKIHEIDSNYQLKEFKDITNLFSKYSEIRVGLAIHERNHYNSSLYHIIINLGE